MRRAKPATQGGPDGLCGLYCLLNHIRCWQRLADTQDERDREGFRYLLEAAERLGILSAHKLWDGYEWHELIEIFNWFARAHRYPHVAVPLEAVNKHFGDPSTRSLFENIFAEKCQVVVLVDGGSHWVLGHRAGENGEIFVHDSARGSARTAIKRPASKYVGVVLCPQGSRLAGLS